MMFHVYNLKLISNLVVMEIILNSVSGLNFDLSLVTVGRMEQKIENVDNSILTPSELNYLVHYSKCESHCYSLWEDSPIFNNGIHKVFCESRKCQLCLLGCDLGGKSSPCNVSCSATTKLIQKYENLNPCIQSCSLLKSNFNDVLVKNSTVILEKTESYKPDVVCQSKDGSLVIVKVSWTVESDVRQNINDNYLGFFVQLQDKVHEKNNSWMAVGLVKSNLISLALKPGEEFRVKVMVLKSTTLVYDGAAGNWFKTLQRRTEGFLSETLTLQEQALSDDNHVELKLKWNNREDKPCFYNIYCLAINSTASSYVEKHIRNVDELLDVVTLSGLSYNTEYDIRISHTSTDVNIESNYTSLKIQTKTCLELNSFNFTKCEPPPPVDLVLILNGNYSTLLWQPPKYTSFNNTILSYKIEIVQEYILSNKLEPTIMLYFINGNQTSFNVASNLFNDSSYKISVFAISDGGESSPASVLLPKEKKTGGISSVWIVWLYSMIGAISIMIFCAALMYQKIKGINLGGKFLKHKPEATNQWISPLKMKLLKKCPYQMDFNLVGLQSVLGAGAFGIVYKGTVMIRGVEEIVAVKMLKDNATEQARISLIEEIEMLKFLGHHPHIVALRAYVIDEPKVALMVEYCPLGDLKIFLNNLRDQVQERNLNGENLNIQSKESGFESMASDTSNELTVKKTDLHQLGSVVSNPSYELVFQKSEGHEGKDELTMLWEMHAKKLLSFARQVAIGMEFLALNKVVHRDLAARNILLLSNEHVKITDFGLSKDIYEDGIYNKQSAGLIPVKWMALESIINQSYTSKSDVWSFAILLWEMVSIGGTPYPGLSNREVIPFLQNGHRMQNPSYVPDKIYQIMCHCWVKNPFSRPSFAELKLSIEAVLETFEDYFVI